MIFIASFHDSTCTIHTVINDSYTHLDFALHEMGGSQMNCTVIIVIPVQLLYKFIAMLYVSGYHYIISPLVCTCTCIIIMYIYHVGHDINIDTH